MEVGIDISADNEEKWKKDNGLQKKDTENVYKAEKEEGAQLSSNDEVLQVMCDKHLQEDD